MYRQGHGDCFLLAFRGSGRRASYMLIDCGYKPGSSVHAPIADIVADIAASTGGFIDTIVITHEHQDHVNGIWKRGTPYFDGITCGEAWFAWTEDPADALANDLRRRHNDQLLGLVAARHRLAAAGDAAAVGRLDGLLSLELGTDDVSAFSAAAADPSRSFNKQSMKFVKDNARDGVRYIRPHEEILHPPRVRTVRVFALGPPRDPDLIADEDPQGPEAFPGDAGIVGRLSFLAAARSTNGDADQPFPRRFGTPTARALSQDGADAHAFFHAHYGAAPTGRAGAGPAEPAEVPDDAAFRRIDEEWLHASEDLALSLNRGINNTSLVLALELRRSRKVLLFAADAQRGNWLSWTSGSWQDGAKVVTARDLLARTVLYKVGHHGSHNATLHGTAGDEYPNLGWMAQGPFGREFAAMITAVSDWAYRQRPVWAHPLPSIKEALLEKTGGRLFQTDTDTLTKPDAVTKAAWRAFTRATKVTPLYFEYVVKDSPLS
jgi:hypothetical protein